MIYQSCWELTDYYAVIENALQSMYMDSERSVIHYTKGCDNIYKVILTCTGMKS